MLIENARKWLPSYMSEPTWPSPADGLYLMRGQPGYIYRRGGRDLKKKILYVLFVCVIYHKSISNLTVSHIGEKTLCKITKIQMHYSFKKKYLDTGNSGQLKAFSALFAKDQPSC